MLSSYHHLVAPTVRAVLVLLLATTGAAIAMAPPAAAGTVGVTVEIQGAGTVHAVRGGTFTCSRTNDFSDDAVATCPRFTHEEALEAVVQLRPTPADHPAGNSEWRFSHWEGCNHVLRVDGVEECQLVSGPFSLDERKPRAVFTDIRQPDVAITSGPSNVPVASTSATFGFSSGDPLASFECSLDAGQWFRCMSPLTSTGLSQGPHTLRVRAIDPSGNFSPSPAHRSWTVDTVAPTVSITAAPSGRTGASGAAFTFAASEAGATQCRLDDAPFGPCPGGSRQYADVPDGTHVFAVRATDQAGNVGPAATHTWTVDTTPPDTVIATGPVGLTSDTTPTFTFSGEPGADTASYECRIDGGAWSPCSAAGTHTTAALPAGPHTFEVRGLDDLGNADPTPALRAFEVVTAAPDTTIVRGPSGRTRDRTPTFRFTADVEGATFECKVDRGRWTSCSTPHTTESLAHGRHKLRVRATLADLTDPTPATRRFTVSRRR